MRLALAPMMTAMPVTLCASTGETTIAAELSALKPMDIKYASEVLRGSAPADQSRFTWVDLSFSKQTQAEVAARVLMAGVFHRTGSDEITGVSGWEFGHHPWRPLASWRLPIWIYIGMVVPGGPLPWPVGYQHGNVDGIPERAAEVAQALRDDLRSYRLDNKPDHVFINGPVVRHGNFDNSSDHTVDIIWWPRAHPETPELRFAVQLTVQSPPGIDSPFFTLAGLKEFVGLD